MSETGTPVAPDESVVAERGPEQRALSAKHSRFVDEYMKDRNATQAAIRAGYKGANADVTGSRLYGNVGISKAIAEREAALAAHVGLTQVGLLSEVHAMAHSNVTHYVFDDETGVLELAPGAPADAMKAVSSVKYRTRRDSDGNVTRECEFKLWDKPGMVRLGGRYVGIKGFADQLEVKGDGVAPVVHVFTGIAPPADAEPEDGGKGGA
jgi:phage terminase small subunit